MADSVLGFLRGLAAHITCPDGKPYCAACGDIDPAAGDGACPHLQARALLATLAEPPDMAAMERRAGAARSFPSAAYADACARDVQTLLAEHLRARTALEDAAPDLRAIRERTAAYERDCAFIEERLGPAKRSEAGMDRAALLGLVDLLALTVAERGERLAEAHAAIWGLVCLMTNCSRWIDQRLRG